MLAKRAFGLSMVLIAARALPALAAGTDPVVSDGATNTAMGTSALQSSFNSSSNSGYQNTAGGYRALLDNTTGFKNAAFGYEALSASGTGSFMTAIGSDAMSLDSPQADCTAIGQSAMQNAGGCSGATAVGAGAAEDNWQGVGTVAIGFAALGGSTANGYQTAVGAEALEGNFAGNSNTAVGFEALMQNFQNADNVAVGDQALAQATGSSNLAIGYQAAYYIASGNNNIHIGHTGNSGDSGLIRIGSVDQNSAYLSGVYGATVGGMPVYMNSAGQLGTLNSSARFKTDVVSMTDSLGLGALRPVTFHLKSDRHGSLQYGLIAEQVAAVYPDLVVRNENGRIDGVSYEELTPILLLRIQQNHHRLQRLQQQLSTLQAHVDAQPTEFAGRN